MKKKWRIKKILCTMSIVWSDNSNPRTNVGIWAKHDKASPNPNKKKNEWKKMNEKKWKKLKNKTRTCIKRRSRFLISQDINFE